MNIHQTNDVAFRKFRVNILPLVDGLEESLLKAELESIEKIFEHLSSDQDLSIGVNNQLYQIRGKVANGSATLGSVLQVYSGRLSPLFNMMDQLPVHIHDRDSASKLEATVGLLEYIEGSTLEIVLHHHSLVGG